MVSHSGRDSEEITEFPSNKHSRLNAAAQQFVYLWDDTLQIVNRRWWRFYTCVFSETFLAVASYRVDRALYLLLGRNWRILRTLLSPLFFIFRPWFGRCEIHYLADIGRRLKILHPSLGVVISAHAIIGDDVILTGGNCIGNRRGGTDGGAIVVGDGVLLGANATILGPLRVGREVVIAAGSVVVASVPDRTMVGGVPARPLAGNPA